MKKLIWALFCLFPCLLWAQVSNNFFEETPPRYELGVGVVSVNSPDYAGSNNNRLRFIPLPYGIFRGEYLRSDDEGTRARLFASDWHEVGVSLGANFPVKSTDNPSRAGMPNLDMVVEVGPRLMFRLLPGSPNSRLNITITGRAAFSTNFRDRFTAQGFSYEPSLAYWYRWHKSKTTFFTNLAFEFGSAKLNQYFYEVSPEFTTTSRPTYHAESGLVQTALAAGMGQNFARNLFVFTGLSWRNLDLAANRESPLVETRDNIGFIFGVVWTFFESEEKVKRL